MRCRHNSSTGSKPNTSTKHTDFTEIISAVKSFSLMSALSKISSVIKMRYWLLANTATEPASRFSVQNNLNGQRCTNASSQPSASSTNAGHTAA